MQSTGYFVRDTLIYYAALGQMPTEKRDKIVSLTSEFRQLGYIDARTQLGPDQSRRMTDKQRKIFTDKASRAFQIETEIRDLLKSDEQISKELNAEAEEKRQSRISQLNRQKTDLEAIFPHKLKSSRSNPTKRTYEMVIAELETLTHSDVNRKKDL